MYMYLSIYLSLSNYIYTYICIYNYIGAAVLESRAAGPFAQAGNETKSDFFLFIKDRGPPAAPPAFLSRGGLGLSKGRGS